MSFFDYINNMYILSFIAMLIGLFILYIYDYFEKKQYNNAIYLRIGVLIYLSCLATIYISRIHFFQSGGCMLADTLSGGGETLQHNVMSQSNDLHNYYEHFKTGVPTF